MVLGFATSVCFCCASQPTSFFTFRVFRCSFLLGFWVLGFLASISFWGFGLLSQRLRAGFGSSTNVSFQGSISFWGLGLVYQHLPLRFRVSHPASSFRLCGFSTNCSLLLGFGFNIFQVFFLLGVLGLATNICYSGFGNQHLVRPPTYPFRVLGLATDICL